MFIHGQSISMEQANTHLLTIDPPLDDIVGKRSKEIHGFTMSAMKCHVRDDNL